MKGCDEAWDFFSCWKFKSFLDVFAGSCLNSDFWARWFLLLFWLWLGFSWNRCSFFTRRILLLGVEITDVDDDTVLWVILDTLCAEKSAKECEDTRSLGSVADGFLSVISLKFSQIDQITRYSDVFVITALEMQDDNCFWSLWNCPYTCRLKTWDLIRGKQSSTSFLV